MGGNEEEEEKRKIREPPVRKGMTVCTPVPGSPTSSMCDSPRMRVPFGSVRGTPPICGSEVSGSIAALLAEITRTSITASFTTYSPNT